MDLSQTLQLFFSHILKGMEITQGTFILPDIPIYLGRVNMSSSSGTYHSPKWLLNFGSNSMQLINKRLYRQIRRALCACVQDGASVPHRPILQLYCTFIAPWKNLVDYGQDDESACYTVFWRKHVCANLPFYLVLLPLFMHVLAARMGSTLSKEMEEDLEFLMDTILDQNLLDELRMLERELRKYQKGELFCSGDEQLRELIPWVIRQTGDWERAALANENGEVNNKDLMLQFTCFDERMDNGIQLGCVHVARWILQQIADNGLLQTQAAYKLRKVFRIDGNSVNWEISGNENHPPQNQQTSAGLHHRNTTKNNHQMHAQNNNTNNSNNTNYIIRPGSPIKIIRHDGTEPGIRQGYIGSQQSDPRFNSENIYNVQYFGDKLLRPISSYEFGPAVYPLVRLSQCVNMWLDLDREFDSQEQFPENLKDQVLYYLRKKDLQVSFRVLADKRLWFWIFVLYVLWYFISMFLY
eukprot:TRINITY_DN1372_c0_g1_i2.p2 TRINITY_DN1372_c0_g1~~TRINITY_DN1372_c0_g1_i2.p2  ORF type:complete len:468 (-),score=56.68 TRINITY_DN1372_c0_g1_i2:214-1617(-)